MSTFELSLVLLDSVKRGDTDEVAALLAAGADPNVRDLLSGYSALHQAAGRGHLGVVRALVEGGARLDDRQNTVFESPLAAAVLGGHAETVAYLLCRGADPNERLYGDNKSLLDEAVDTGQRAVADLLRPPSANSPHDTRLGNPSAGRTAVAESAGDGVPPKQTWRKRLVLFYRDHGYIRRPVRGTGGGTPDRAEDWEVRFLLNSRKLLASLQDVLRQAGFTPGEAFRKYKCHMQPVYGRQAVERLRALVTEAEAGPPDGA
jgi:hypothetical protein